MDYVLAWLTAFVWTLVFELPVYALFLRARFRAWWATPVLTLGVNLLTHPLFSWWVLARAPADGEVALVEVLIAAVEGFAVAMVLGACATEGAAHQLRMFVRVRVAESQASLGDLLEIRTRGAGRRDAAQAWCIPWRRLLGRTRGHRPVVLGLLSAVVANGVSYGAGLLIFGG